MPQSIAVGVLGHTGRVGRLIVRELEEGDDTLSYAGGAGRADDAAALFMKADVLIDFTLPEATARHAELAAQYKKPLVIGTTGLKEAQEKTLQDAAKKAPILYAANMSVGVNMLLALVEQAAARLDAAWDIEIMESHHKHKIDAPSGTALALGRAAQDGRGGGKFVEERSGKRAKGTIGFAVQRGGDVVGEHDVTFFGNGERLTLSHKATDRALFARGALRAATWLVAQKPGLYSMRDALAL